MSFEAASSGAGWKWGAAGLLVIALAVIWRPGCRYYPPVSSPESLQLIKLVYSACNTRNQERLAQAEKSLAELVREEKVTAREKASFEAIFALARDGEWTQAEEASFRFAQDQIGRGNPAVHSSGEGAEGDHGHAH